ncbi:uncharacterized protein LOC110673845 [Hevea brasiliensis]|uniref:uncharacterized protein LOC110673845 n=1 Tax=Hevea brasiliensis TaxID=3981 RepID=UPI0025F8BB81|nr:uncharacterized protein LOC110673845 [Hevea brasiliensis]
MILTNDGELESEEEREEVQDEDDDDEGDYGAKGVKRSTVILCLKGREHSSSSVPVRYIPKNSSKVNELEKSLPAKGSEKRVFDKNLNGFGRTSNLNEDTQNGKQTYKKGFLLDPQQAFSGLKEEINHDAKVKLIHCELMEEPKEVIMETAIEHESVTSKMNVQAGKTMLDAEKMAIEILATRDFASKKSVGNWFLADAIMTRSAVVSQEMVRIAEVEEQMRNLLEATQEC